MRNIEARRLTEKVVFYKPTVTRDAAGGQVTAWQSAFSWNDGTPQTISAEVINARGSRMVALGDIELIDDIVVNVRLNSQGVQINERWRVKWQDRTYYLIAPPVIVREDGVVKLSARRLVEGKE